MHEADDRAEGRVVAQLQVVAAGDVERVADGLERLGLLDRVDAQVGFHVQVEVEHLQRVAGLLGDNAQHLVRPQDRPPTTDRRPRPEPWARRLAPVERRSAVGGRPSLAARSGRMA
jgi:hypothetical protein